MLEPNSDTLVVTKNIIPLTIIKSGTKVTVHSINGGKKLNCRLLSMGISPGAELTVIANDLNGAVLVGIGPARLALGRGMSMKIMVSDY